VAFHGVSWKQPNRSIGTPATATQQQLDNNIHNTPQVMAELDHFENHGDVWRESTRVGNSVDRKSQAANDAMRKEMSGLTDADNLVLRELTRDQVRIEQLKESVIVPLLMMLDNKTKQMTDGEVHEYIKARLCANGSKQNVSHEDKTSPTPSHDAIRLFIANAQRLGLQLFVADYSQAYIQGIWPEHVPKIIGTYNGKHYLIEKPLYGLKQSGKLWRDTIVKIYTKLGFTMDPHDPCIFRRTDSTGTTTVLIYVDDVLYFNSSEATRKKFETDIESTGNKLTLMGPACDFAGYTLTRLKDGALHLSCKNTIVKMMAKNHSILKPYRVRTPWQSDRVRSRRERTHPEPLDARRTKTYQSLVGSFIYATTSARPEISTVLSRLASHQQSPTEHDLEDAIYLAMYLRDTLNHGIVFPWGANTMHQVMYVDANHGDKRDSKQRARTGALIYMGGCLVAWTSHKHEMAVIGSRDAEYVAAHDGIQLGDVINYMQDGYEKPGATPRPTPVLYTDNKVMLNQLQKGAMPTVQRQALFRCPIVKDHYDRKMIIFDKVHTSVNPADLLTKETPPIKFTELAQMMVSNVRIL
jgi:hypothetical protein